MAESKHLDEIITRHNRITNAQVVFLDIQKYSKRRTQAQISTIDLFTSCLDKALAHVGRRHLDYAQTNDVNFATDIVKLPTGDGAAIGFTFDGLHDIHLEFALQFLREAYAVRVDDPCERFNAQDWCNCHPYFNTRIGIDEGKLILYRDVNGQFNVAGGVVNMAARVMSQVEANQVAFGSNAYDSIVDMVDDPMMSDRFVTYNDVKLKHGLKIVLHHYVNDTERALNSAPVERLEVQAKIDQGMERMREMGLGIPALDETEDNHNMNLYRVLELIKALETGLTITGAPSQRPAPE